jgi:hypothetical protein
VTVVQSAPMARSRVPPPAVAWLAWALCAISATLGILGLIYGAWNYTALDRLLTNIGPIAVLALSFPIVGALIATHRPGNPLGWIFCAVGLFGGGLVTFGTMYGEYALRTAPGTVPGGPLAIWLGQWTWSPGGALLVTFVLLLFPDGRLPSRRWRPVAWLSALVTLLYPGLLAALLWPLRGPALVDQAAEAPLGGWPATVLDLMLLLIALLGLACLAGLAVRFRRARGVERQQLKWFLFASAITLVSIVAGQQQPVLRLLTVPLVAAIPVATGIAILRYRLYDIDRLISRTLVYALLTALLGVVYAGVVLVLVQLSGGIATKPPNWAVAAATLAAAALFQPARRRIQQAVDRRFNRGRYDAANTIEAFSTRLREQVDLDTLSTELLAVVDQTMEPTRVSLWLRSSPHGSSGTPRREARPITWAY